MPETLKQVISEKQFAALKSLPEGASMVFEVEIPRGDRPKQEVTVTREAGLLRVDASVRFSGHTAGVTWFSPQYEIIHRPVMVLGGFHGKHACYLQPLPQEKRLEIGDMFQHEAVAFA